MWFACNSVSFMVEVITLGNCCSGNHTFCFVDMDYKHHVDDSLMRFFDHCERFVVSVEKNKTALKEVERFKSSAEMDAVRRKISNRLQIPYSQFTPGNLAVYINRQFQLDCIC